MSKFADEMFKRLATVEAALVSTNPLDHEDILDLLVDAKLSNSTVFLAGNGGSFLNAMHFAEDLTSRLAIRTHVLGSNLGLLTALSNDTGYVNSLAKEFLLAQRDEDKLIVFSTSGNSNNIIELLRVTEESTKVEIFAFLGDFSGGYIGTRFNPEGYYLKCNDTGLVEDMHMFLCHSILENLVRAFDNERI